MSAPSCAIARSAASRASAGVRSISTLAFSPISRTAAAQMIAATTQRGDRVALGEARVDRQQPDQHGQRADHVAGEVKGVGAQRRAGVAARDAQRDDRAAEVDDDRHGDHREQVPVQVRRARVARRDGRPLRPPRTRLPRRGSPPRPARRGSPRGDGRRGARGRPGARRGARRRTSARRRSRRRLTRCPWRSARGCPSPGRRRASARRAGRPRRSTRASCAAA